MAKSVTKADLISSISEDTGLKKVDAERALLAAMDGIQEALCGGKKVVLVGFGAFSVTHRKTRMGRDPQTGQPIQIAASNTVKFRAGKALKDALNPG